MNAQDAIEVSSRLDMAAENESLISIQCWLEYILRRKDILLTALEAISAEDSIAQSESLVQHKQWLLKNLSVNNHVLSIAMGLLQDIYSAMYSGRTPNDFTQSEKESAIKVIIEKQITDEMSADREDANVQHVAKQVYADSRLRVDLSAVGSDVTPGKEESKSSSRGGDSEEVAAAISSFHRRAKVVLDLLHSFADEVTNKSFERYPGHFGAKLLALEGAVTEMKPRLRSHLLEDMYSGLVASVRKCVAEISALRAIGSH